MRLWVKLVMGLAGLLAIAFAYSQADHWLLPTSGIVIATGLFLWLRFCYDPQQREENAN